MIQLSSLYLLICRAPPVDHEESEDLSYKTFPVNLIHSLCMYRSDLTKSVVVIVVIVIFSLSYFFTKH